MTKNLQYILIGVFVLLVLIFFVYKYRGGPRDLFNLFFRPKSFAADSAEDSIKRECKTNTAFKERWEIDAKWKNETIKEYKNRFLEDAQKLRSRILFGFVTVMLTLLCALGIAYILAGLISIPSSWLSIIQIVSAFFILWAIIGKLGYPIQTIAGGSIPEITDDFCYIVLNIAGIFALFFTQFYSFFKR